MPTVLHPADTRGYRDMGWIKLYQSFNPNRPPAPNRRHFGVMMILDNGIIAPGGKGFGMHPHENMEIVSIVVSGTMMHSDTAGHSGINIENAVQLISAGTGIEHSEHNQSDTVPIDNLQIWFLPKPGNLPPNYQQMMSPSQARDQQLQLLLSPDAAAGSLKINQDVWLWRGSFDRGTEVSHIRKLTGNGLYLLVIEGTANAEGKTLHRRDGMGITDQHHLKITFPERADILIIDVPM